MEIKDEIRHPGASLGSLISQELKEMRRSDSSSSILHLVAPSWPHH
ncbi:MAG: hypothetical protein Q8P67_10845 [archaeon]|nr:hypothetical protein [archaeon]